MEPVYCPNGHPNRPGTRICIVCRALLEPSAPAAPPGKPPPASKVPPPASKVPPPTEKPAAPPPTALPPAAPARRNRVWPWLLLLLLLSLAALGILVLRPLLFPGSDAAGEAPVPTPESQIAVAEATGDEPASTAGVTPFAMEPSIPDTATAPPQPSAIAATDAATDVATDVATAVSTITPLATIVGIVITPTFAFGPDANFIQNGDFADDWANGWTREALGEPVGEVIEMRPEAGAAGEGALYLEKTGPGSLQLAQRVVLTFPIEGLVFRARLLLAGAAGAAEGRAALILRYEDAQGQPLGASVWLDGSAGETGLWGMEPLPPAGDAATPHRLDDGWQAIEVALGRELADELPDVDPVAVRQVTIILALLGEETCAPAGCPASLVVSNLSLTAELP